MSRRRIFITVVTSIGFLPYFILVWFIPVDTNLLLPAAIAWLYINTRLGILHNVPVLSTMVDDKNKDLSPVIILVIWFISSFTTVASLDSVAPIQLYQLLIFGSYLIIISTIKGIDNV